MLVFQHHPHRPLPNLGRIPLVWLVHDSILSGFGVSGKPGAVQTGLTQSSMHLNR
jgi:hypothetical protein